MKVSPRRLWSLGLVLLGLLVVVATYRDYGIPWDEPVQSQFGEGVARYFKSGGEDRQINEFLHMRFYGPLFELATALLYSSSPPDRYDVRHLAIALTGLLTLLGLFRIAGRLPGRWGVLYSGLALATMPRFYGHAFINSKDIPFACGFVWSMAALVALTEDSQHRRRVVFAGVALGTTLAIRPGGLPLLLVLYGSMMAFGVWSRGELNRGELIRLAKVSAVVWSIAWLGMIALWPWAHESPIVNPITAILAALSFPDVFPVLFEGQVTMSDALPRYYLVKYLAITTPPLTLLLSLAGIAASIRVQRRGRSTPESLLATALQFWLFAPLIIIAVGRPNVYDGLRHVLFVLPALALFSGWGAVTLIEVLPKHSHRGLATVALGVGLALPALDLVRLHPYQMTYFNSLVGGLEGANGKYEIDYWVLSYREAIEWVNDRAALRGGREVDVLVAVDEYSYECAEFFAAPGVHIEKMSQDKLAPELPKTYDY